MSTVLGAWYASPSRRGGARAPNCTFLGVCGEHTAVTQSPSIFFHHIGIDYVFVLALPGSQSWPGLRPVETALRGKCFSRAPQHSRGRRRVSARRFLEVALRR